MDASISEIDSVARAARAAAREFAATSREARGRLLEAIAEVLTSVKAEWIERAHEETHLPLGRLEGEHNRTTSQLRLFATLVREGSWVDARIDTALPDRKPAPRPDLRRALEPLGPVAVFGASNFPFAFSVAGGDTASALAAGNPVVVKAHPAHPKTSDVAASAIRTAVERSALSAGVFGMVHGASPEVGLALARHEAILAIGFTGSTRAGRALFDAAAARPRPIPVFAEMSSVNPLFVLPSALRERGRAIAEGLVDSFTLGVGQFCTKPGLVLGVQSVEWDEFTSVVVNRASNAPKAPMLHPGIEQAFEDGVRGLSGVEWLSTGAARVARVSGRALLDRPELAHEVFGPFTLLVTASDEAELLALADSLPGQLTATLHATREELTGARELVTRLRERVGRLLFNGYPTGVEVSPAMQHGGPYPATTDERFTSVGTAAIFRFSRPVCYQNCPAELLPAALRDENPLGIWRLVNGELTRAPIGT
jgi:NADP-dependent aldehyde dehydrogenase